jgi:DNA polymerase-1
LVTAGTHTPPCATECLIYITECAILQEMTKDRLVLIDAFALIHRAFHAIPPLTTKDGNLVNAVYGFTAALLSSIKNLDPEYLACGFDLPGPTRHHEVFKEYKAHRPPTPDELASQIPFIKEVLKTFNIPIVSAAGYEGEDIIATIIAKIRNPKSEIRKNMEFIIVTGDLDCLQLIDENTKVYSMARGINQAVMYDIAKVKERYGLSPSQFVDFKALKGDPSDNIPGVPGIGEKGAAKLIIDYKNLENIYENLSKLSEKLRKILKENKEQAFLSQKLSKISHNAPIDFKLADARVHDYDSEKVVALFNKLGFKSLISRLPESKRQDNQPKLL